MPAVAMWSDSASPGSQPTSEWDETAKPAEPTGIRRGTCSADSAPIARTQQGTKQTQRRGSGSGKGPARQA